ncbi:MAG: hypothetical protein KJP10_06630 [Gammaproteobacteria bacterium]|nr:hypothetical protein [Gammaproteobacteria bacterium]
MIAAACSHSVYQALHVGRASVFCVLLCGLPLIFHVATLSRFPVSLEELSTTTSAHLCWLNVKNTPIEDFYQRLIKSGMKRFRAAGKPAAQRTGWIDQ